MSNEKLEAVVESFLKVFPVVIKYFILLGNQLSDPQYSYQEYQVLHVLKEYGKVPISAVGAILIISKPRMTYIVDKLIDGELVERFADKNDRRIINIGLTEKGSEFTFKHAQNLKAAVGKRFANLGDDELEQFLKAIITMQGIMERTKEEEKLY